MHKVVKVIFIYKNVYDVRSLSRQECQKWEIKHAAAKMLVEINCSSYYFLYLTGESGQVVSGCSLKDGPMDTQQGGK